MNLPKRRKMRDNPYILGVDHLLNFIDSQGNKQTIKISDELYNEFNNFELADLKEMNEYDRHIEHSELTDEMLYSRVKNVVKSLEDIVLDKIISEILYKEIDKLSNVQKRRIKKYYFDNMTLENIAKQEGCSKMAIKFSIDCGLKKIYQNLKF